jgi:hypothetical protein
MSQKSEEEEKKGEQLSDHKGKERWDPFGHTNTLWKGKGKSINDKKKGELNSKRGWISDPDDRERRTLVYVKTKGQIQMEMINDHQVPGTELRVNLRDEPMISVILI